jgi:replication factor C subunit 2/4
VNDEELTEDLVLEVSGSVPSDVIEALWASAVSQDVRAVRAAVKRVVQMGYPADQVFQRLLRFLLQGLREGVLPVKDIGVSRMAIRMAEAEKRLIEGANEEAQLADVMSVAVQVIAQQI